MYLFGHVGITIAAARGVDSEADLRPAALLAVLPDLIDKPLAALFPAFVNGNTRSVAHGLLGAALILASLLALRLRPARALFLWACYAAHLLLDRMWLADGPIIFLWPFLGPFPRWTPDAPRTPHLIAYNVVGEAIGLAILARLAWRHRLFEEARRRAFLKTGRLGCDPGPEVGPLT